jgi:hypothetical protein
MTIRGQGSAYIIIYNLLLFGVGGMLAGASFWRITRVRPTEVVRTVEPRKVVRTVECGRDRILVVEGKDRVYRLVRERRIPNEYDGELISDDSAPMPSFSSFFSDPDAAAAEARRLLAAGL